MALEMGAMKLGRVAIDGSKVKANASKHKAMSYKRMKEEQKRLRDQVRRCWPKPSESMRKKTRATDGTGSGDELPAELQRREDRLQRIREAKRALEQRAGEEAAEKNQDEENNRGPGAPAGDEKKQKPEVSDQYNFTDPESRIMKGPDGFVQAYNAQIAVEPVMQLIVGQAVTQQGNDKKATAADDRRRGTTIGTKADAVLADSGLRFRGQPAAVAEAAKVDAYMAVAGKQKHNRAGAALPTGPAAEDGNAYRPHAPQTADQDRAGDLCPNGKRSSSRCSDRSSKLRAFGSSCCVVWRRHKESGPWSAWPIMF